MLMWSSLGLKMVEDATKNMETIIMAFENFRKTYVILKDYNLLKHDKTTASTNSINLTKNKPVPSKYPQNAIDT